MSRMDWMPLLSTGAGALIALSGSFLVDLRRGRDTRDRDRDLDRWSACVDFALALGTAHSMLRRTAAGDRAATTQAMTESGAYQERERLLMSGTPELVVAGEDAFHRLVDMQRLIRAGEDVRSPEGHEAYHRFAEALWRCVNTSVTGRSTRGRWTAGTGPSGTSVRTAARPSGPAPPVRWRRGGGARQRVGVGVTGAGAPAFGSSTTCRSRLTWAWPVPPTVMSS